MTAWTSTAALSTVASRILQHALGSHDTYGVNTVSVDGRDGELGVHTNAMTSDVSPGFFRTLSIPLLAGRNFTSADRIGSPPVAIVNEAFVRALQLGGYVDRLVTLLSAGFAALATVLAAIGLYGVGADGRTALRIARCALRSIAGATIAR